MAPPRSVEFSTVNSTKTPLAAGDTFVGEWEAPFYHSVYITISADCPGTVMYECTHDSSNSDRTVTEFVSCGGGDDTEILRFCGKRSVRVCYVNTSDVACTRLEVQTNYGDFDPDIIKEKPAGTSENKNLHDFELMVTDAAAEVSAATLEMILEELRLQNFHLAQITGVTHITVEDV